MNDKKETNIINLIMIGPPIVITLIIVSIYGWMNLELLFVIIPGWAIAMLFFLFFISRIQGRIEDNRDTKRNDIFIKELLHISDKEWRVLPKEIKNSFRYKLASLKKIKNEIFDNLSKPQWLDLSIDERISIFHSTFSLLKEREEEERLKFLKESEERERVLKQKQLELQARQEEERKSDERLRKLKEDREREQRQRELEEENKLQEEKNNQLKIENKNRRDLKYKELVKRKLLEKERKLELEAEAIKELEREGKLSKDYTLSHERKSIPSHIKQAVWKRDKQKCVSCGSQQNLEFDHIIPVSTGGSNNLKNIQLLCFSCNRTKSNKIM